MEEINSKSNESIPLLFILISVFLYSLFPLIGVFGTTHISGFVFSGLSHTLSALLSIVVSFWLSLKVCHIDIKEIILEFIKDKIALRQAIISGIGNYLSHAFLFISFSYISKAVSSVIFESWPILVMLFLVLFSRNFTDDSQIKKKIHYKTYILSAIAFIGFIIITFNDFQEMRSFTLSSDLIKGISLALASAFLMAYSVSLGRNTRVFIQYKYGTSHTKVSEVNRAFIASAATKFFGMIGFLLTLPFLPNNISVVTSMEIEAWFWVFFNGIIIVTLGSLTYREALARTKRPEIAIFWYLTPILALMWLWFFDVEPMSYFVLLGAFLIIASNILLYVKKYSSYLNISILSFISVIFLFLTIK